MPPPTLNSQEVSFENYFLAVVLVLLDDCATDCANICAKGVFTLPNNWMFGVLLSNSQSLAKTLGADCVVHFQGDIIKFHFDYFLSNQVGAICPSLGKSSHLCPIRSSKAGNYVLYSALDSCLFFV